MSRRRNPIRALFYAALTAGALLLVGTVAVGSLFDLGVPFTTTEKDHSPPVILNEIVDLAEFRAAEAEFEVIVDRETDVRWVPSFIAGERVQFVAVGSVDATVDFGSLDESSILWDEASDTTTIILPPPMIGAPVIDLDNSGVMNRDRGMLDRVGGVFSDNPTAEVDLIREAQDKMSEAVGSTDLETRAEQNTQAMLTDLLGAVGVDNIRIVFASPAP